MIHKHDLLSLANDRLRRYATFASVAVAMILIVTKGIAYLMTDSVSMLSSLLDSAFDLVASLVTAYGVHSALRPPDSDHRYGHGKAEPLAGMAQAVFIIVSSLFLINEALGRFYHPQPLRNDMLGYGVMALAIILTLALVSFQHHVVHETGSVAVGADRLHYLGDLAVNMTVVAAFAMHSVTGVDWCDPVFALAIAGGLLLSAFHILKQALFNLMDAELPDDERDKIRAIVLRQKYVQGVHDMRTRCDSDRIFIELHVEMDPDMTLRIAHEVSEAICAAIVAEIPNADVLVHQDPAGLEEDRLDAQIARRQGDLPVS